MPAVAEYPNTPIIGQPAPTAGLVFPAAGGLTFDAGFPLTFPPDQPPDLAGLFPSFIPQAEQIIYQAVKDACNVRTLFPQTGHGLPLPAGFSVPPDVSLVKGLDETYPPITSIDPQTGALLKTIREINPIPVVRGWPAYPGDVPAIGVAEAGTPEDPSGEMVQAGFAGDAYAYDSHGNVLATCAYYAEPLQTTVVVELIHTNRDERDRLHDQLRRVIYPLKHLIPASSSQVRDVRVDSEKQDLPLDEQPIVMYVSLFTVAVTAEALIPTEITPGGVITSLQSTVTPTIPDAPPPVPPGDDNPNVSDIFNVTIDYT